jgi:hypothetical protein
LTEQVRDDAWRLALAGDVGGLEHAAALLLDSGIDYEGRRARAFAHALAGDPDAAVAELRAGATEDWPFASAQAADAARVHFLAGDDRSALAAVEQALRDAERVDPAVARLATSIAKRSPELRLRTLRVVVGAGTLRERLVNVLRLF